MAGRSGGGAVVAAGTTDTDLRGVGGSSAVRLHTDGASRGNPGHAAIGVVIERAGDGAVLDEIAEYLGETTNNIAEYRALIAGLRRAAELGATEVEVWSDSELMVRQLQGRYQVKNEGLRPLFVEASRLSRRFAAFRIEHTLRGGNRRADELANVAIDRALGRGAPADGRAAAKADQRPPVSRGGERGALDAQGAAPARKAAAAGGGPFVDVFALAQELPGGGEAEVGGGLRLARVAPGQSRVAAWALVLRGALEVGGRMLEPGQACRGGARYRAVGEEDAVVLEASGQM